MAKIDVNVLAVHISDLDNIPRLPISPSLAAQFRVVPLRILTNNGGKIFIDRVTGICRQASMKAGGIGNRYTCLATFGEIQKEILIYKDEDNWFMEDKF